MASGALGGAFDTAVVGDNDGACDAGLLAMAAAAAAHVTRRVARPHAARPARQHVGPAAAQAYFLAFPALPAVVAGPAGPAPAPVVS